MIERVFHHIWISRDAAGLPDEFERYRQTWRRLHPHWDCRLWNLHNLDFPLLRGELLAQCGSFAQMADLLRMEILYRHGGFYVDADFECFKPIDDLTHDARHVFCSENGQVISTGFLGAVRGSELVRRIIDNFPAAIGARSPNQETGPRYVTEQLLRFGCGPDVKLLPSALFYPYAMGEPRVDSNSAPAAYAAHHWAHSWAPKKRPWLVRVARRLAQA